MTTHLRKLWDSLKSSYWFVPLVMMALATVVWFGTNALDHLSARDKKAITWLYISDADSMRTLLFTIAAAVIGIIGVVFSIIMVPLSIAATQFGPRLIRNFLRDTGTQVTLGTFTSTFIFCMLVLLHLSDEAELSLPQISVNVALLLGLTSFATLIYFINHVAVSIQAPVLVSRVSKELHTAIEHELPDNYHALRATVIPGNNSEIIFDSKLVNTTVMALASGYVQARDDSRLLRIAAENNIVLQLLSQPGDFVVKKTPLAIIWPNVALEKLNNVINAAFILGSNRTLVQDVTFGINELVEVAIRALSPAINDPFTAMTCLDWLGSALCHISARSFPPPKLFDHQGNLRLIRTPVSFTYLTDAAFNQIREYGRTSTAVTLRLMETIKVVAQCIETEEQRKALLHHAILVERGCHIGLPEETDQNMITNCYREVKELLNMDK
jgi:uncharacterized membrane protein